MSHDREFYETYQNVSFAKARPYIEQGLVSQRAIDNALAIQANYGNIGAVQYLIDAGANVTANDNNAHRLARKARNFDIIDLLESYGAQEPYYDPGKTYTDQYGYTIKTNRR